MNQQPNNFTGGVLRGVRRWVRQAGDLLVHLAQYPWSRKNRSVSAVRRRCDLAFIIPMTDGEWAGVEDLLDSMETYVEGDYEVVLLDDRTTDGSYRRALARGCQVLRNPYKFGGTGLNATVRLGFQHLLTHFDAPVYLKIDPDALVIGPGLTQAVGKAFEHHPTWGIAGNYLFDCDGGARDFSYWRGRMTRQRRRLGEPLRRALANGYPLGAGVQGGAYCVSQPCLAAIEAGDWLARWRVSRGRRRWMPEDHLFTLLVYAAGYEGGDIGRPGQPFGVGWRGLPMTPAELVAAGKIVTHSIKFEDPQSRAQREFFRRRREIHRGIK